MKRVCRSTSTVVPLEGATYPSRRHCRNPDTAPPRVRGCVRGAAFAAVVTDLIFGEPPAAAHPTVWMGRWIARGRRGRSATPIGALVTGAGVVLGGIALSAAAAAGVRLAIRSLARQTGSLPPDRAVVDPVPFGALVDGALLKCAVSVRALVAAGAEVERALRAGDLPRARRLLGYHLVSRETARLTAAEVAGATIESLAENLCDGIVAPLFAYRAGGLPAAYAYRFVNTADAMLGYRTAELEWLGKVAALTDDAANYIPSRLAAMLIALGAGGAGGSASRAVRSMFFDSGATASPNAGWPMAAMAGALGVRLDKVGAYSLNPCGRAPGPRDIARARRIVLMATLAMLCLVEAPWT